MGSVEVPKKHKACIYDKPGTISTKVEEIDTPEPGFGEVLVNLYISPPALISFHQAPFPVVPASGCGTSTEEGEHDACLTLALALAFKLVLSCPMFHDCGVTEVRVTYWLAG